MGQCSQSSFNVFYTFQSKIFLSNPFALSSMTVQSQIESCLEFDKKNSALKFVTTDFKVHFLYLSKTYHAISSFHSSSFWGTSRSIRTKKILEEKSLRGKKLAIRTFFLDPHQQTYWKLFFAKKLFLLSQAWKKM